MGQQDMFNRVLASLHEAALNDAYWPAASALIDEACGAMGNELVVGQGPLGNIEIIFAGLYYRGQHHGELEREYVDNYYQGDERPKRFAQLTRDRLVHVTDLYTDRELKASPTFNEILPRSSAQDSLNVLMEGLNGSHVFWMLADPCHPDGWGSDQIEMIERLLPHLRQFARVRQLLVQAEAFGASFRSLLENTRLGVIHLDRNGTIVASNDRALDILRQGDGLLDRGNVLSARLPDDDARLQKMLRGALPTYGSVAVGGFMTVRRLPHLPPLALHVSPVNVRQMNLSTSRVAALVLVVDPSSRPGIDPDLVAKTLGLTPSESQVAVALAEGSTVRDIAAATRRKESSVRWFIEQIYDKQGISRQADLVRLVLSLAELPGFRR